MTKTESESAEEVAENIVTDSATREDDSQAGGAVVSVASSAEASSTEGISAVADKVTLFRKYKETLVHLCNFKNEYSTRVDSLLDSWKYIGQILKQTAPDATENLFHWVLKYTVQLILVGDWIKIDRDKRDSIKHKIEGILPRLQAGSMSRYRCDYILKNIENPWGSEELLNVLRGDPWTLTTEDMEFLTQERGCMILLRLQKLCEIKCDDMAFAWSSKSLSAYRAVNSEHSLRKSTSVKQFAFLFDVYLCHLHKYGHIPKIIDEVKQLDLDSAQQLIHRNVNPNAEVARLAKYRKRVARLASDIVIAKLMVEELSDQNEKYYCDILKEWLCIHKTVPVDEFRTNARKLYMTAISRKHLYLACDVIKQMEKDDWHELLLELCVRAITGDLNELELLKSEKTCDEHIVIQHEVDLSYRYIYLADLLKNHTPLAQECILTAFSLNPTKENYQLVRDIAMKKQNDENSVNDSNRLGSEISTDAIPSYSCSHKQIDNSHIKRFSNQLPQDVTVTNVVTSNPSPPNLTNKNQNLPEQSSTNLTIKTQLISTLLKSPPNICPNKSPVQQPALNESLLKMNIDVSSPPVAVPGTSKTPNHRTSIDVLHSITGSSKIFDSPSYDAFTAPSSIFDSLGTVNIPEHIRSDLSVLLSNPRLKILSWMLPWPELDSHCQKLLKEDCKLSIVRQSLAGANDKLQYLHLDYNMFRHLPESECPGIEKGYEQYSMDPDDLSGLSDLALKRKKSKKSKKSSKERKEKQEKSAKTFKERKDKKAGKKNIQKTNVSSLALQPSSTTSAASAQRQREYEELLRRALYIQQLQHQLQLSQSLSMLNQHAPINRNFFLPYIAAQMQDQNKTDKPAIAAPPPQVPLQKVTKLDIVKKTVPKPSSSTLPPPLQLQMPQRPSSYPKAQTDQTHIIIQPVKKVQPRQVPSVHQSELVHQQPPQLQVVTSASIQKVVNSVQQSGAQTSPNKPVLVQPVLIKDNNTLVKLALLQNITQKMLLQRQQQQQQQQMQQHVQQQFSTVTTTAGSGNSTGTSFSSRLMIHPPALQLTQSNVILNPLNSFQNDSYFGINRNIPTSTITSIQTSIARCNLPVETTVPAPMKMSSVIKPNAQINVQPNSGKNIYSWSPHGTVATVIKFAQTKPTISKATIARTAAKTTTVKSVNVKTSPVRVSNATKVSLLSGSVPKAVPTLIPSAKSSTAKSKVVKATPVKIKVNPAGITLLPATSFAGILRKYDGHSDSAPPLSVIKPVSLQQVQKEPALPQDTSSTESAPESLRYNFNLYNKIKDEAVTNKIRKSTKKPKVPKESDLRTLKVSQNVKDVKLPKVPKVPRTKTLKEPKLTKIKSPKTPKVRKFDKTKLTPETSRSQKSTDVTTQISNSNENVSQFLNLNVQQDVNKSNATAEFQITNLQGHKMIASQNSTISSVQQGDQKITSSEEMVNDTSEQVPISASREIEQYIIKIREGLVDDSTKDVSSQDEENNEIIDMLLDMEEHKELTEIGTMPNSNNVDETQPTSQPSVGDNFKLPEGPENTEFTSLIGPGPEVASMITVETTLEPLALPRELTSELKNDSTKNLLNSEGRSNEKNSSNLVKKEVNSNKKFLNNEKTDKTDKNNEILPANWNNQDDFLDHINNDSNSPIPPALQDDYDVFSIPITNILNSSSRSDDTEECEKLKNGTDYSLHIPPDDVNPIIDLPAEERCSQVKHTIFQKQFIPGKRDPRIYLRRLQPSAYEKLNEDESEKLKNTEIFNKSIESCSKDDGKNGTISGSNSKRARNMSKRTKTCCGTYEDSDLEVETILSKPTTNDRSTRSIRPKTAMLRAYYANRPLPTPKRPKSIVPKTIVSKPSPSKGPTSKGTRPKNLKTDVVKSSNAANPSNKAPTKTGRPRGRPRKYPLPGVVAEPQTKPPAKEIPKKSPSVITLSSESESELTLFQVRANGYQRSRNRVMGTPYPFGRRDRSRNNQENRKVKRGRRSASVRRRKSTRRDDSDDSFRPYYKRRLRRKKSAARSVGYRSDNDGRNRRGRSKTPHQRCKSVMQKRTPKRYNSNKRNLHNGSDSWMGYNVPKISPRRRSRRRSRQDCYNSAYYDSSSAESIVNMEIELLTNFGLKRGFETRGRSRRSSTLNVSYYDHTDSESDDHEYYSKPTKICKKTTQKISSKKLTKTKNYDKNQKHFNLPRAAWNDPKLFIQKPIVNLTRCSNNKNNNSINSPFTSDSEMRKDFESSLQPKRIKKIYLKNIRSSKIAIVNESSCSSPRTESEISDLMCSKNKLKKFKTIDNIKNSIKNHKDDLLNINLSEPEKSKKFNICPIRSNSVPPKILKISKDMKQLNNGQIPELRLKKLDNKTMLKYRQNILVNGIIVASPIIALKRLKINQLPVRLKNYEYDDKIKRPQKLFSHQKLRKNIPVHLQNSIREDLENWILPTNRFKSQNRFINLSAEAEIPIKQWNNLDMFQVSSDDDSLMEITEIKRPVKIPRLDNKFTKNCNLTKGNLSKENQTTTTTTSRELSENLCNKKNFMFDIYSVVVKPDFMDSPPSSLFSCNIKKDNIKKLTPEITTTSTTTTTSSITSDNSASDLFLSIAAKFLIKSLSVTAEKQHLVHEMMNDKKDCWLPEILGRRILEQEITEILFGVRNVLKDTINSIIPNKSFRLINETLDESKNEYYLGKKLINNLPNSSEMNSNKWAGGIELKNYNEIRKFVYHRTLGDKLNNKCDKLKNLSDDYKDQNRIFLKIPGFQNFEYFTAPSYHCLPVVRIVHSTLPLEDKSESESSSSVASNELPKSSTSSQNNPSISGGQKATLVPIVHKNFGTSISANQPESTSGNVRVIIPQVAGGKKGQPIIHNSGTIKTTATLIKVDKKDVQDRIGKIEPNFVLLGCGNSNKFIPIKKDDRILLTSSSASGLPEGVEQETPRTNIHQATLKNIPKVSLNSGSSNTTATILPVQFIYKSDAGMIHFTPVSGVGGLQNLNVGKEFKAISLVKAETKTGNNCIETNSTSSHLSVINTRSLYEENYAKFIQTSSASEQNSSAAVIQAVVQKNQTSLIQNSSETSSTLPKFTQAFGGKNIYIDDNDDNNEINETNKTDQMKSIQTQSGNFLFTKQNLTISKPIICSISETLVKNKTTRIVSGSKQQLKIIHTGDKNPGQIGQRTALLSPLPISVPIVSQSAISNYVQTRYMRPFFHISQGNIQTNSSQGAQQVLITTSQGTVPTALAVTTSSNSQSSPNTTVSTKIKSLPTLTVTKKEKCGKSLDQKKKHHPEELVDNSTLEQLREFDLVLEQVKERSTTSSATVLHPVKEESNGLDAEKAPNNAMIQIEESQKCTGKINEESCNLGNNMVNLKLIQKAPFVVLANNLNNSRIFTSPTKTVCVEKNRSTELQTTQSTQTKQTAIPSSVTKGTILTSTKLKAIQKPATSTTVLSPTSGYNQKISKPQEDEQTVQRIYDILAEYAEQLRNSPDLNNKPAPRRRSNPLNSCTSNGKKRKTLIQKPADNSITSIDLDQTMDSEDSSCGTSSLYNRSPLHDSSTSIDSSNHFVGRQQQQQHQSATKSEQEDTNTKIANISTLSGQSTKLNLNQQQSVNVINFGLTNQNQSNRSTAVLVPGKYLLPLNAIKSSELQQDIKDNAIKKLGSTSTQTQVVYKTRPIKIADTFTQQKATFKPITVQNVRQPLSGLFSQKPSIDQTINKIDLCIPSCGNSKTAIVFQTQPNNNTVDFSTTMQRNNLKIISVHQQTTPSTIIDNEINSQRSQNVQETSVIIKAEKDTSNNHQMNLSLTSDLPEKIHQQNTDCIKKPTSDKIRNNLRLDSGRSTSSKILKQLNEGRKLALEREMKFQKSLSDECEDLGVDEPSASDLFPEADLLFDPTSSSFENNSQDDEIHRDGNLKQSPRRISAINGIGLNDFSISKTDFAQNFNNSRSNSLREVIGWDSVESTGAIMKNSNNFIIHHTSVEQLRKSPSPSPWTSPAEDLFKVEFKSDPESVEEEEHESEEQTGEKSRTSSDCDSQNLNRKRPISSRWTISKKNNCPCYTTTTVTTTPSCGNVLNSSTQTSTTSINYDKEKISSIESRSNRLLTPSQIIEHFGGTKRIRSIKLNTPGIAETLNKFNRFQKLPEPQKESSATIAIVSQGSQQQDQTVVQAVAPSKRMMTASKISKETRR